MLIIPITFAITMIGHKSVGLIPSDFIGASLPDIDKGGSATIYGWFGSSGFTSGGYVIG
jgi:hypothetical protein